MSKPAILIAEDDGTIIGVRVRRFDEMLNIRARGGVVLAAGGYIMNETMFAHELSWMPRDLILRIWRWRS